MARKKRIKFLDVKTFYHIFSKTAGGEFFLDTDEKKNFFIETIFRLSKFFSIKILEFVVMTNHFHLIVETCPEISISNETLIENAKKAKIYNRLVIEKDFISLRKKLNDISEFTKLLKQIYAQWYNKRFKRTGYFWGSRFKSIIIQFGRPLLDCILYVILNPVRAKIVKSPENYKFGSFSIFHDNNKKKILQNKKLKIFKRNKIEAFTKNEIIGSKDFINKLVELLGKERKYSVLII